MEDTQTEEAKVHLIYHDGDGSVYPYSKNGELLPWPEEWPERIASVREFCRARGIVYKN